MPMRYRQDSLLSRTRSPPSDTIQPTDADDSIVLSDLVRTGEASRLRRRGAMRLDHNLLSAQRNDASRPTPPTVVVARTPSWIEPPSDGESTPTWEPGYDPASSLRPGDRSVMSGADTYGYTLYCGGEEPSSLLVQRDSPYVRSPLPSYPPVAPYSNRRKQDYRLQNTNGCGAVIHLRASHREGSSVWVGKDEATSAVVPMDASYFELPTMVRTIRSACGCLREGVGCTICGNTLGTRYKPCQAAAEGLFSIHRSSQIPVCPQGPRYWHGQASTTSSSTSSTYIYNFFASNVTSSSPAPSSRNVNSPPLSDENFFPVDNPFDFNFLDRLSTASPIPMTDDDRASLDLNSRSQPETRFDPDGALIPSDPGSPDKIGAELMLFPER